MSALDDTKAILGDLIAFPTVSADSNLDLIAYTADRLSDCGAVIEFSKCPSGEKANLFATLGPDRGGGIVLSGHTDVVPANSDEWASDPFQMVDDGTRLFGRGACDMKGFVAAALAMAPRYAALNLKRPIHFAFTYEEETGCLGARQLVAELAERETRPAIVIVGEPTDMRIIEGHKGCYEYATEFTGLEGHGSAPDRGVNAVHYAVRYIARLLELGDELKRMAPPGSRFEPPWTTVQVGRIEGGTARNVIAGDCTVDWEMRPVATSDADHVKTHLAALCRDELLPAMRTIAPDAAIRTHVIGEVCGLEPMDENAARDLVSELTGANGTDLVAFGTEAGLFQQLGLSAVVCGPGSIEQAHKPDEFVSIAQLDMCLSMLKGLEQKLVV
jgi:acetylornithine deacetylase